MPRKPPTPELMIAFLDGLLSGTLLDPYLDDMLGTRTIENIGNGYFRLQLYEPVNGKSKWYDIQISLHKQYGK